ncbi:winged helix-turn-helix domain-containing protein [Palleronia sp. KMU-117]|uniref:winged helix-turn-helix domain-containing protein n=1 Tax=Palleronia sp. KMU-117 TaxID=3434108 RepID=UPI003D731884
MTWEFGAFRLDPERFELTFSSERVRVEPQVLAMLIHLVRNRNRLVSRDELAEAVWDGAAVSDASISSRIRSVRAAVGDNGVRQQVIRTIHGRGFRFLPDVSGDPPARPKVREPDVGAQPPRTGRPSIAVLPLTPLAVDAEYAILADAIPHEIIQALSRLRWLSVTARGSSFRFRQAAPDVDLAATALGVRYVLSGVIEASGGNLSVTLELTDGASAEVIWGERLTAAVEEIDDLRHRIVVHIIAALEIVVPAAEAQLALRTGAERFDAWANYHIGLRHLYRFTASDNAAARHHFECAARLDPSLARAQAGLSFTSFLDAFLRIAPDVPAAVAASRAHAERGLELDPLDPFVTFTMGRSHWLTHDLEGARQWLSRATVLNPNFAQGFYASAFTSMLLGDPKATTTELETALALSPLDPLLYGMHGVRAQMLVQQGDYPEAARWAERAASTSGAHYLIAMIAVVACGLAGEHDHASRWRREVRRRKPDASSRDYFNAFPSRDIASRSVIAAELRRHGF